MYTIQGNLFGKDVKKRSILNDNHTPSRTLERKIT